mmetsp:Transcript_7042/g.15401  ORF Transcript_7042/g.15401 Transcript_7042/m.15401 type:complete len:283 (-) Transcript_7042:30-878(-)
MGDMFESRAVRRGVPCGAGAGADTEPAARKVRRRCAEHHVHRRRYAAAARRGDQSWDRRCAGWVGPWPLFPTLVLPPELPLSLYCPPRLTPASPFPVLSHVPNPHTHTITHSARPICVPLRMGVTCYSPCPALRPPIPTRARTPILIATPPLHPLIRVHGSALQRSSQQWNGLFQEHAQTSCGPCGACSSLCVSDAPTRTWTTPKTWSTSSPCAGKAVAAHCRTGTPHLSLKPQPARQSTRTICDRTKRMLFTQTYFCPDYSSERASVVSLCMCLSLFETFH